MEHQRDQQANEDTVVIDSTNCSTDCGEDQRETKDYPVDMTKRGYGTADTRPFRGDDKRRSSSSCEGVVTERSILPCSSGSGYFLFQGGNGRTFQPYCWDRA